MWSLDPMQLSFAPVVVEEAMDLSALKCDIDNWNAAAWSNFVKVYAVDDGGEPARGIKRDGECGWKAMA